MNGKDIFLGLQYVGDDLIEKAERGQFPAQAGPTVKKRLSFRKPMLIAAILALTLLLVGCAVVYVLSLGEIKLGEKHVSYDVYDHDMSYVGQETQTQQVLTLAGLSGTPASQAAREWYAFLESYDPDRAIRKALGDNVPEFPAEYYGYDLYTQEMKDKLDEILAKYNLKLRGKPMEFKTSKLLLQALGMDSVLNPGSEAMMDMAGASYYENGILNLHFHITIPGLDGADPEKTDGSLYYRPKNCFIPDTAVLTEAEWEEWNYTTASGDKVLILRSEDAGSAWIFRDMANCTISLRLNIIRNMYEEKENGVPVAKFDLMTKAQLEQVADAIDFSLEPKLVPGWENLDDGAVPAGQEINGYRIEPVSAFTDGWGYQIVLRVTAPEEVDLMDPHDRMPSIEPGDGVRGYCAEDGDGKRNTCHYILEDFARYEDQQPEDGGLPYPEGFIVPVYWEDLHYSYYDAPKNRSVDTLLTEGTWAFDVPLNDADTREIELLSQPITATTCVGWTMDGTDVLEEMQITSVKLRAMSIVLTCEKPTVDFFCFNGRFSYIVMKDGTQVQFSSRELSQPIDLDQVAYVQLADGTILPMPGVDHETVLLLSEALATEPEGAQLPVYEDGLELLSEPVTLKNLAGYATDPTGDMEPLYEYFQLTSFVLHPEGALALDHRALESPDTEILVMMKDGSQILLTNNGCDRTSEGVAFSTFVAQSTMDLTQVEYLLLPDGTVLSVPETEG